nr:MAG TPA: hypothetical protein [Caudoviricetes sp.]
MYDGFIKYTTNTTVPNTYEKKYLSDQTLTFTEGRLGYIEIAIDGQFRCSAGNAPYSTLRLSMVNNTGSIFYELLWKNFDNDNRFHMYDDKKDISYIGTVLSTDFTKKISISSVKIQFHGQIYSYDSGYYYNSSNLTVAAGTTISLKAYQLNFS